VCLHKCIALSNAKVATLAETLSVSIRVSFEADKEQGFRVCSTFARDLNNQLNRAVNILSSFNARFQIVTFTRIVLLVLACAKSSNWCDGFLSMVIIQMDWQKMFIAVNMGWQPNAWNQTKLLRPCGTFLRRVPHENKNVQGGLVATQ
jgi:hypothetical protein